jgi:thiol-disulfide isomerase/thioredoxin
MKKLLLSLIVITSLSCSGQKSETTAVLNANGDLVGIATKDNFLVEPFNEWFTYNYDDYSVNTEIIEQLKPLLKNVTIKAFMGTWCGDSQEQTPIFYKIFDTTNFNYKNLELITVDSDKKTPTNLQEGFDIERVPTFIFYKNGKEIGRFVEYPRETVEADMLKIVSGKPYKHSYEE